MAEFIGDVIKNSSIKNGSIDRLPPQNLEAEMSVLGSILIDKEALGKIADFLAQRDFYKPSHGLIFAAMLELYEKGEPIDVLSLSNKLTEKNEMEKVGGMTYLSTIVNSVPTAAHVAYYAKIIQRKKVLRDLIEASYHIAELGYGEDEEIENILDEAERHVFSISQRSFSHEFMPIRSALEEAFERIDTLHKGDGSLRGLPTGFLDLDNILAGLQKSDLVILAARPSLGKTTLALNIASNIAIHTKSAVGMFSLEMSKEQLVDRLRRLVADGPNNDFAKIQDAMGVLSEAPIFIDDGFSSTAMQIRTVSRRLQSQTNLGLIVIDYLQLMESRNKSDNRVQEISEISRALKNLARELNVPVLALSQLSRAVEMRSPQIPRLSDLRESGSIEQDADVVLFIYREDREKRDTPNKNIAEIHIAK
ncbi:replicative DNA helicase, partial [Patescibacteria group bacterium]|nr:replicative DNA helicase [Patescibacteria group bacterium]